MKVNKKIIFKTFGISKLLPKTAKKTTHPKERLSYIGKDITEPIKMHLVDYSKTSFTKKKIYSVKEALPFKEAPTVTWLDIKGVHNTASIEKIGKYFNIHRLVLEDITNTTQRPKFEESKEYLFLILKIAYWEEENQSLSIEQISLVVGENYIVSFQERDLETLEILRRRLANPLSKFRERESDYLMYGIIDMIIDHYFTTLEKLGEKIEKLENRLITSSGQEITKHLYKLKRELVYLRKSIWPMREVINGLLRTESKYIHKSTHLYLRDLYDHITQVVETIETFREMTSGMLELYLSSISNRMNEIMKILTIFTTTFIPLTFIVGVYGMNFKYMPELSWRWGYFGVWGIMFMAVVTMIFYFKKKKWL